MSICPKITGSLVAVYFFLIDASRRDDFHLPSLFLLDADLGNCLIPHFLPPQDRWERKHLEWMKKGLWFVELVSDVSLKWCYRLFLQNGPGSLKQPSQEKDKMKLKWFQVTGKFKSSSFSKWAWVSRKLFYFLATEENLLSIVMKFIHLYFIQIIEKSNCLFI